MPSPTFQVDRMRTERLGASFSARVYHGIPRNCLLVSYGLLGTFSSRLSRRSRLAARSSVRPPVNTCVSPPSLRHCAAGNHETLVSRPSCSGPLIQTYKKYGSDLQFKSIKVVEPSTIYLKDGSGATLVELDVELKVD